MAQVAVSVSLVGCWDKISGIICMHMTLDVEQHLHCHSRYQAVPGVEVQLPWRQRAYQHLVIQLDALHTAVKLSFCARALCLDSQLIQSQIEQLILEAPASHPTSSLSQHPDFEHCCMIRARVYCRRASPDDAEADALQVEVQVHDAAALHMPHPLQPQVHLCVEREHNIAALHASVITRSYTSDLRLLRSSADLSCRHAEDSAGNQECDNAAGG